MNPIIPTVGRVVYFTPAAVDAQSIIPDWQSGVCAALVTAVHNENCVNLTVFDANGQHHARCSVCHVSTLPEVPEGGVQKYDTWDWMPYQKGQAAKTEQLEAKFGDAHQKPSLAYCQQTGSLCNAEDLAIEAEIKAKGLIYPRVEVARIDELMSKVRFDCHIVDGTTTTVITAILPITDHINFTVATEIMACVDPRNFNKELGEKHGITKAANAARNKLWELEGYYLARKLEQDMALDAAIASGELEIVSVEALSPHNTINS